MDRLNRLRLAANTAASDVSNASDTGFHTADDTSAGSTKYLSFTDDDSCTPKKPDRSDDVALGESTPRPAVVDSGFGAGLSPISQDGLGFSIGGQIDAKNILSGGVDIFDDCHSNDGDGLVIDDDAVSAREDAEPTTEERASSSEKVICEPNESANLSVSADATLTLKEISESQQLSTEVVQPEAGHEEATEDLASNNEVILQIDGKNIDALDIGNGLYLYRKVEGDELNAIQILQDEGQPQHFKFLKVRQIGDSNLEVYEEQILEVPITNEELEQEKIKERPKQGVHSKSSHLPISDVGKALSHDNSSATKTVVVNDKATHKHDSTYKLNDAVDMQTKVVSNEKSEKNIENKLNLLKNIEGSRKSPILGNFTSMTLHSSSNKEGAPPTKTMINLPLSSGRHFDTNKKTIEVSTENSNFKCTEKTTTANWPFAKADIKGTDTALKTEANKMHDNLKDTKGVSDSHAEKKLNTSSKQGNLEHEVETKLQSFEKTYQGETVNIGKSVQVGTENSERIKCTDAVVTENKLKQIENKKDVNSTKLSIPNVVSKWVLRSDSIDEKCKKEIKSIDIIGTKNTSYDISEKKSIREMENKHKHVDLPNAVISTAKVKCKGIQDEAVISSQKKLSQTDNIPPHVPLGESSKNTVGFVPTEQNRNLQVQDRKGDDLLSVVKVTTAIKNTPADEKILKEEMVSNSASDNKYNNEMVENVLTGNKESVKHNIKMSEFKTKHTENNTARETAKLSNESPSKPVPFGKWTEGDKQQYLNKLKEHKLPSSSPSSSPAKSYQLASAKNDKKRLELKKTLKADTFERAYLSKITPTSPVKPETKGNRDVDFKGLIDKTIEGLIMDMLGSAGKPPVMNHPSMNAANKANPTAVDTDTTVSPVQETAMKGNQDIHPKEVPHSLVKDTLSSASTMKNEKSATVSDVTVSSLAKCNKIPKLLPLNSTSNKNDSLTKKFTQVITPGNLEEDDSEDDIIDSEPVTGDMQWPSQSTKDCQKVTIAAVQKMVQECAKTKKEVSVAKKTGLTEVEFDKFVRRNSTTQVESNNSVVIEPTKIGSSTTESIEFNIKNAIKKNSDQQIPDNMTLHSNIKMNKSQPVPGSTQAVPSQIPHAVYSNILPSKNSGNTVGIHSVKLDNAPTYQTKVKMAYQSALYAKNLKDPPIKILENNPVKVSFVSSKIAPVLNLPAVNENTQAVCTVSNTDISSEGKVSNVSTMKIKHQRKQVLIPVESPPIEIIEPSDLIDDSAHKKKRKIDHKTPRIESDFPKVISSNDLKNIAPKKKLLDRASIVPEEIKHDDIKDTTSESLSIKKPMEKVDEPIAPLENTPKRGRGRPRKHRVEKASEVIQNDDTKKSPEISDSFDKTSSTTSIDEEEYNSDEEGIIRENWTMGKINDKIVCPICNKLFRSETIVFKHVKHCSTLMKSPTKRMCTSLNTSGDPKKGRLESNTDEQSQRIKYENLESQTIEDTNKEKNIGSGIPNASKGDKETSGSNKNVKDAEIIILDSPNPSKVIVIEDSPMPTTDEIVKSQEKGDNTLQTDSCNANKSLPATLQPKVNKVGRPRSTTIHTCEICGKTFRQLSYLVHHKNQHKNQLVKPKPLTNPAAESKPILSCEVCGKDFRKLHHLVEHREIHNTNSTSTSNVQRKASTDRLEHKRETETSSNKQTQKKPEDSPAGFRCEPCDKSFRKLHHLVEHRETHGSVNRQKNPPLLFAPAEKTVTESPTCEVCGKSFRKLHHLIEHREQHTETHEKKERKSSLIAKDIIHECSLCYMVFPNEPSLNKHFAICQKKKKTPTPTTKMETTKIEEKTVATPCVTDVNDVPEIKVVPSTPEPPPPVKPCPAEVISKIKSQEVLQQSADPIPEKIKKSDKEVIKTAKNAKLTKSTTVAKKAAKIGAAVTKKSRNSLTPVQEEEESSTKSKDSDDEALYMINPSFQQDSDEEEEIFMNICVAKRNSLQFDGPSAEVEFKKRRTSLQVPSKTQKLAAKKIDKLPPDVPSESTAKSIKLAKRSNSAVPSHSVDDSVKFSIPRTAKSQKLESKTNIPALKTQTAKLVNEERNRKTERRKSLTGIAKRKSLGKSVAVKPISNAPSKSTAGKRDLMKQVRHVCDCGAPFSSATLLAQHTSVAHTPPRVRRPRAPPLPTSKLRRVPKHSGVPVAFSKPLDK